MEIKTQEPLSAYTTMRLGGPARFLSIATSIDQLIDLIKKAKGNNLEFFVLGGGSNVIVRDEGFNGLVILNRIPGFEVINDGPGDVTLKIGAGEAWDQTVAKTVEMNLSGIECMSGIPGTVGATPVQNVGAYGQEIADTLVSIEAYDTSSDAIVTLTADECNFSYRSSRFKNPETRHHVILSITLKLSRSTLSPPFYDSLQSYFDGNNTTYFTPAIIRDAVLAIRAKKLPDPSVYPNTGSFFKNPIIEKWLYDDLATTYPDMPSFEMDDDHVKIPAGWLIEQAGMKGHESHGMRTFETNALVFVNIAAQNYADLDAFSDEVRGAVRDMFRINLEQEPETL